MMRNVSEIQAELVRRGYLPAFADNGSSNIDGRFGERSLDAYNHFRATLGKGPVVQISMAELNADLFPEEQPLPKPKRQTLVASLITHFLISTAKGLPIMTMLSGYKTYILAVLILVSSAAETFIPGFDLPGYSMGLGEAVMVALALITGRSGATADVNKALGK